MRILMTLALLPACVGDSFVTSVEQRVEELPEKRYERVLCDENLCILHQETDSDGDGVADADEEALAQDPRDPRRYPEVSELAALIPQHALPSFEAGNSLLVLLPTMDANGLPVFGGEASLPARRSALDAAGISVPDEVDLGRGFSVSRTLGSTELAFHGLFTASTKGRDAGIAAGIGRALDSVGNDISDVQQVYKTTSGDMEFGQVTAWKTGTGPVTITYEDGPNGYEHFATKSEDGSFQSETRTTQDKDGNSYTHTTTHTHKERTGEAGTTTTDVDVTTDSATSADGRTRYSTTTTTATTTDAKGNTTTTTTTTTKSCTDSDCTTSTSSSGQQPDAGDQAGETTDEGSATATRNPEHDTDVGVSPQTMHMVLAMLGSNVNVSSDRPLVAYDYNPIGIGNKWGPIALVSGDESHLVASPTFLHIPSATPDYDPEVQYGLPPTDVVPEDPCLYCFQP